MNLGFELKDWNEVEAVEMGDFQTLPLGGHEIIVKDARLYTSEQSGNTSLKVSIDVNENGEYKGYFQKKYDDNTDVNKKWDNNATKYMSLKKESLKFTKGFITTLEKSNNGFKFDTSKGWEQINGLKCAGVFGLREYEKQDGSVGTSVRITQFRSIDKLEEIAIPKVELLDGSFVNYEDYQKPQNNQNSVKIEDSTLNEELPF